MGVWVTGVRDAWEDFDVVVNNGNYSRTSLFRSRERIIGLFTAHSNVLSGQLVSCIWKFGKFDSCESSPWRRDQRFLLWEGDC